MKPDMNPDLSQLRDIHLPDPVSWWPPAPGWWGLLTLLIVFIITGIWLYRRYQASRWRKHALAECAQIKKSLTDDSIHQQAAQQISALLRRVAITRFPRNEVASLFGDDWIDFLNQAANNKSELSEETAQTLLHAPYSTSSQYDVSTLLSFTERWIKTLPAKKSLEHTK